MTILSLSHYKWIGYLLIISTILLFTLNQLRKNPRFFLGIYGIITIVGLLYPTTKIAQFFLIGPRWYRGYFADIGSIAFISLIFFIFSLESEKNKNISRDAMALSRFKVLKIFTFITGIAVIAFEIFQIERQKIIGMNLSSIKGFTGRGDINDIFVFFIMLSLQVWFIDYKKNSYLKSMTEIENLNKEMAEIKKIQKRENKKKRRYK